MNIIGARVKKALKTETNIRGRQNISKDEKPAWNLSYPPNLEYKNLIALKEIRHETKEIVFAEQVYC